MSCGPLQTGCEEIFCVVGKFPLEGFSQTRLAKSLGQAAALHIYQAMLRDFFIHYENKASSLPLQFYGTPQKEEVKTYFLQLLREFPRINFHFHFQKEGPFFTRLAEIFKDHSGQYIHLTGTDIPMFPYQYLSGHIPSQNEMVIGPDIDGGFYYFGSHAKHGPVFRSRELASSKEEKVLETLVKACQKRGPKVRFLKEWSDIDTLSDLQKALIKMKGQGLPTTFRMAQKYLGKRQR